MKTASTTVDLSSVHCVSSSEVWIGGNQGTLLRWDGQAFAITTLTTLRFGSLSYQMVIDIAGSLTGPHGLWVLVSGGEVLELHPNADAIVHQLHMEGGRLVPTKPNELVVVGAGAGIMRKTF